MYQCKLQSYFVFYYYIEQIYKQMEHQVEFKDKLIRQSQNVVNRFYSEIQKIVDIMGGTPGSQQKVKSTRLADYLRQRSKSQKNTVLKGICDNKTQQIAKRLRKKKQEVLRLVQDLMNSIIDIKNRINGIKDIDNIIKEELRIKQIYQMVKGKTFTNTKLQNNSKIFQLTERYQKNNDYDIKSGLNQLKEYENLAAKPVSVNSPKFQKKLTKQAIKQKLKPQPIQGLENYFPLPAKVEQKRIESEKNNRQKTQNQRNSLNPKPRLNELRKANTIVEEPPLVQSLILEQHQLLQMKNSIVQNQKLIYESLTKQSGQFGFLQGNARKKVQRKNSLNIQIPNSNFNVVKK